MLAQLLLTLFETVAGIEAPRLLIFGVDRQLESIILGFEVFEQLATQPVCLVIWGDKQCGNRSLIPGDKAQ